MNQDDHAGAVNARAQGPQALNITTNQLSTPVFVILIVALFIAATVSATAVGVAWNASDKATIAEREARLAQNRNDTMEVDLKVLRGVLENQGVKLPEEHKR